MKRLVSLILALGLCLGLTIPVRAAGFSDIPAGHYAAEAIDRCVAKGIASGFSDGTFKPGASVTRAQFCTMVARAFFPDRLQDADTEENRAMGWFVPAALALYHVDPDRGVLAGTSFENDYMDAAVMGQPISRYDMAQLMCNTLSNKNRRVADAQRTAVQGKIGDWFSIPEKYQYAVASCYALGILSGQSDGNFSGEAIMNRAQGTVVLDRLSRFVSEGSTNESEIVVDAGPSETPNSSTPAETAKTLTNGKAITEANVKALFEQLKSQYPKGTVLYARYDAGSLSPVKKATDNYKRAANTNQITSTQVGCASIAAFFSDKAFGSGVIYRKVDRSQVKAGDIAVHLDSNGNLWHVDTVMARLDAGSKELDMYGMPEDAGGVITLSGGEFSGQTKIVSWNTLYGPNEKIEFWSCY